MKIDNDKLVKLFGFDLAVAIADIILFSPGLFGLLSGRGSMATAFGGMCVFLSIAAVVYGDYSIIAKKEKKPQTKELKEVKDYVEALEQYKHVKVLESSISTLIEQIDRLKKKKDALIDLLTQRFGTTEMSYQKFEVAVLGLEKIFYMNVRSILNRLNAFDYDEYIEINRKQEFSDKTMAEKIEVYNEYISYVKTAVEDNEEMLLKLDKLLFEISKLDSITSEDIENMQDIKEIDELIKQTKLYK